MCTIVPNMGTRPHERESASVLFGKTRRAVLSLLFAHPDEGFYLRELARLAGVATGAAQREVRHLAEAGIIERQVRGNNIYYQANRGSPVFSELQGLVLKTSGVADVLRASLAPLANRIRFAAIYGSVARGAVRPSSDVDVIAVGDVSLAELVSALAPAQQALQREINPTVYPAAEFRAKLAARQHFLTSLVETPLIFLWGDEHELARLAPSRLARRAHQQPRRDLRSARRG